MLIVLRGNSGSGKSTTARLLREAIIQNNPTQKVALVEQDYLRRVVLKEKEAESADNIDLIFQTVAFALERGYSVILEGILYSVRYKDMLSRLYSLSPENYLYYFDLPFEETVKRHKTKLNADEFGEAEMRQWFKPDDALGLDHEKIIGQELTQPQMIDMIIKDTGLGIASTKLKA